MIFDIIGVSAEMAGSVNVAVRRTSQLSQQHTPPGRPGFSLAVRQSFRQNPQNPRWVAQIALIPLAFPEKRHHPLSGGTALTR
jgi:hypothetical protein